MARSPNVRLDAATAAALDVARSKGLYDSDAVRAVLRDEVRRLAADPADREEMRRVREELAGLASEVRD